jgi:hypothetical protein
LIKLAEYPLRVEEIVTSIICACILTDDYWRSPRFRTLCGKDAKWPGHGEVESTRAVTCIACWSRVLPEGLL